MRRDGRDPNRLETIDGQQRLTTIVLFAIAAIRVLVSAGVPKNESPVKELAEIFLAKDGIMNDNLREKMKIIPHSDNIDFLAELMQIRPLFDRGGFDPRPETGKPSQTQMKKAVSFFVDKFEETDISPEAIDSFVFKQMKKIVFSRVVAEYEVNPNPIFAALNIRGVPLSIPELVKNHFLSILGERKEQQFDKKWEKIKPRISKGRVGRVGLGEKELPAFLRAVFICKYGYVREGRLFPKIVDEIVDDVDVERFFSQMDKWANFYRGIVEPSLSEYDWPGRDDEERATMLLTLPGAKVSNAFILASREKFSGMDFSESLRCCYAIGIRNKICGMAGAAQLPDVAYNNTAHEVYHGRLDSPIRAIKGLCAPLYKREGICKDRLSTFQFTEPTPNLLSARNKKFLEHFFKILERHLGNNQFDPDHLRHCASERGAGQMRLGNWLLLELNTSDSQSRYETTRQTAGLDRSARQNKLAEWAMEIPDWRIDCLEDE